VKRIPWSFALPVVALALFPHTAGAQQYPSGYEFQVNAYTSGDQRFASAAADASGHFIVAWTSYGAAPGVVGRRFDHLGNPQGGEFQISAYTTFGTAASVAAAADGRFVVVWQSTGRDGSGYGVFGRRFDANGVPQGDDFQINTYTTGEQGLPQVAADASGNFVVVWQSYGQDGAKGGIFARRFDASGTPLTGEFMIPSAGAALFGDQAGASLDMDAAGNFVVVWGNRPTLGGPSSDIAARRFDAAGNPQGDEFLVSTGGNNGGAHVARDGVGNFVVVWSSSSGFPIPTPFVNARSFGPDGTPLNGGFAVPSVTTARNSGPNVGADLDGQFIVTWQRSTSFLAPSDVIGRRFDAAGTPLGEEFLVNTYTTGTQARPIVAATPHENFVVVWESRYQDGSGYGVFGQRFGDLIFKDGVESGDLSRWSSSQADGGDLDVTAAAAMAGTSEGIRALVDDTTGLFVQDDSPQAEGFYRARFYFDPNGFDPGEASNRFRVRMFIAFDAQSRRVITLVLRRIGGNYAVMGRVRLSDGTRASTPFIPITDAAHDIEVLWIKASGPGANDGLFRLFVDDNVVANMQFLNNDASAVEFVRLGALTVKPGASGTLFYDQFESRREFFIGPE
jgi:hypothetical protein